MPNNENTPAKESRIRRLAKKQGFILVKPWGADRRNVGGTHACYVLVPHSSGLSLDGVEQVLEHFQLSPDHSLLRRSSWRIPLG
jgi:hypothetical protein